MVSAKAVRQALYNKLNVSVINSLLAKGSASIHHAAAPSDASYPLVIFNQQAGTPTHAFGGTHFDSQVWLVKAIVKGGSSSAAEDIDEEIADQLDFAPQSSQAAPKSLSISGATTMHIARESAVVYAEVVEGETYRHHGHYYRIIFQDT